MESYKKNLRYNDNLKKEQMLVVDEQMAPFKGHSGLKQYMLKKPNKWDNKIYILAGSSGMVYDFKICMYI